jgi:prevent-host-death family protein
MAEVGVVEAKNRLAEMIDKAARGEEVIITRRGKPVARLVAADSTARKSTRASERKSGKTRAAASFDWDAWKKQRDKEQNNKARAKTRK